MDRCIIATIGLRAALVRARARARKFDSRSGRTSRQLIEELYLPAVNHTHTHTGTHGSHTHAHTRTVGVGGKCASAIHRCRRTAAVRTKTHKKHTQTKKETCTIYTFLHKYTLCQACVFVRGKHALRHKTRARALSLHMCLLDMTSGHTRARNARTHASTATNTRGRGRASENMHRHLYSGPPAPDVNPKVLPIRTATLN